MQWSLISILAHSGDVEAIGVLGAALAVSTVSFGFFNMGLRQGIATDLSGTFPDSGYWVFRILTGGLACAAIVLFASLTAASSMAFAVTLAVLLPKLAESFSEAAYGFFQRSGDLGSIARSQLLRAVLAFAAFLGTYTATASLFWATLGWGLSQFAVFALADRSASGLAGRRGPGLRELPLLQIALTQLPVAAGTLIGDIGLLAPRFLVDAAAGDFELGRFTAVYYLFQAANILVLSLLLTFLSPLARSFQDGRFAAVRRQVFRFQLLLMLCCAGGFLTAVLAGDLVLLLLYGAAFQDLDTVFVLLAAGWSFKYMALVPRVFITAGRYFSTGMVMDAAATALTLSCCGYFYLVLDTGLIHLSAGFLLAQVLSLVCFNGIFLYRLRAPGAGPEDGKAACGGG
ncbi:hypothetical protein KUV26_16150 [Leisingera daeponensis]|uniref:Polysaccharide biosynthesis protein n=1 Tax=Leisingera daeponensis TaxID=405746 RepID=A0ABS7NIE0_9RHOB|nr:hypothetical protein [Leisingera daeponensis]MBY6140972.1 hypothetical protein [Leisingera daeponensis]